MKVLLHDTTYAFLTPGGKTTHAVKLQQEIAKLGVDIQFSRWWDKSQEDADIIHFLQAEPYAVINAKKRGVKTFYSMIFDFESNRTEFQKRISRLKMKVFDLFPGELKNLGYWHALPYFDRVQFMHCYDRENALKYFPKYLKQDDTVIIPHAYDPADMYISDDLDINGMGFPEKYLISCANIAPRKQTVLLARYAKKARVPIVFMGSRVKTSPYYQQFAAEVDNKYVFDPGYVSREWRDCIERHAAGYVLLSRGESGCIAVYEAAAYKMPILLSNLPWAWGYDQPTDISFCDYAKPDVAIEQLKKFYESAGRLDHLPFNALTWSEVAKLYVEQYENLTSV